jgi:hypothetical protein
VNTSIIAALPILPIQIITNQTKTLLIHIYTPHTHPHPMSTLTHGSPTFSLRYDDRHHSERHLRISRYHTRRASDSVPIGVCRMSRRITPITPVGADHYRNVTIFRYRIIPARHHSRRESRSNVEHRIGIFSFLSTLSLF